MLYWVFWAAALYAALKFCHLLAGSAGGFRRVDVPLRTRVRAGEPWLLIGAFGCVALVVGTGLWWAHRFAEHGYASATGCYPKLAAARQLGPVAARFGSYRGTEIVEGLRRFAEIHGSNLGIDKAVVERRLADDTAAYARRYAALAATHDQAAIAAAVARMDECVLGKGAPRGEILRA
jgi:hypothetical protein